MRLPPWYKKKIGVFTDKLSKKMVNFREYILKIALSRKNFSAQNAPNSVWRPGSARTRWGAYSAPQTLYRWITGSLLLRKWDGKGVEGGKKGREGRKGEKDGAGWEGEG